MEKMFKLSDTHYIVVDDSEITKSDWYFDLITNQIQKKYSDLKSDVELDRYKITHSTEPELLGTGWMQSVLPLLLSEVEEAIYGYNVGKLAELHTLKMLDEYKSSNKNSFIEGFKAAMELVKDKLFSVEDLKWAFMRGALINQRTHNGELLKFSEERNKDIQSLLPKTEWNIEFIDGKIKLL